MNDTTNYSYARTLILKLLGLDLKNSDINLCFDYQGTKFKISPSGLKDISLILATEYNLSQGKEVLKVDRDRLLHSQLFHLTQEAIRLAEETQDPRFLRSLTQIYKDLKTDVSSLSSDIEVFYKCMADLKPGISKEECIELIKKYSPDDN